MSSHGDTPSTTSVTFDARTISRPDRRLLRYYTLVSLLSGPAFPIVFLPLLFKFETLKYRFDDDGVSMTWGILFRREIYLTYRRIQDIHLTRNLIQRWLGLATVSVQTASGSAMPEMSIEGIPQADELRDFLYQRMRGSGHEPVTSGDGHAVAGAASTGPSSQPGSSSDEALSLLREIRDLLKQRAERGSGAT